MLEIKKEVNDKKILINTYSNISELYNYIKKTPKRKGAEESSIDGDEDFTGTESFEEAVDLLLGGDEKLYKEILAEKKKLDITKILGNKLCKNLNYNSVVGFQADVPAYLRGIPTSMINKVIEKKSQKIINIFIDGSVPWHIGTSQIKKAGCMFATVIDILEKRGYRCNVYMIDSNEYRDEYYFCCTRIKTDREPFNLKKMAFPLAHPSFFRRIEFAWIERCNLIHEPTTSGYGRTIKDRDTVKRILDKELRTNAVIWKISTDYQVSIDKILEDLKKDGINVMEEK